MWKNFFLFPFSQLKVSCEKYLSSSWSEWVHAETHVSSLWLVGIGPAEIIVQQLTLVPHMQTCRFCWA